MSKQLITEFEVGERIDKALSILFPHYSRSVLEKLIESGDVLVNKRTVKSKYKLKAEDKISIDFTELEKNSEEIKLSIIYEDDNVVIIEKPIGILAHTKGAFSKEGTVASWLKNTYYTRINPVTGLILEDRFWNSNRAGIVHRLDRATSGVMICAKNEEAQIYLQKQFSKRNVKKTYVAVISGILPEKSGLIDVPIERNPKKPATFRAGANGKSAQTEFKVLSTSIKKPTSNIYSLIELMPHTGRTHQLRVHLKYLKHPIVGDEFYQGEEADRLMLHAHKLELTLLGGNRQVFTSKIPKEFMDYLK